MRKRWLILMVGLVLTGGTVFADDSVPIMEKKDEQAFLASQRAVRPSHVGDFESNGRKVSPEEFQSDVAAQQSADMAKFEQIKATGRYQKDELGRPQYVTPDGVLHGFAGQTVDEFIAHKRQIDKGTMDNVRSAVGRHYQAQNNVDIYKWSDAQEEALKAENKARAEAVAKYNQEQADKIGLSKWDSEPKKDESKAEAKAGEKKEEPAASTLQSVLKSI